MEALSDLLNELFLAQIAFLSTDAFLFRAAVVGVAFLRFSGNGATTRATFEKIEERKRMPLLRPTFATLRHHGLHAVKQLFRNQRRMGAFKNLAVEFHKADVKNVF
ncbi:hypothetical protein HY524_01860 [Candidatus Berkelbacteria bacterium]|nr:hypothetical protein [Candidatus Berkelbacteria bacterium]